MNKNRIDRSGLIKARCSLKLVEDLETLARRWDLKSSDIIRRAALLAVQEYGQDDNAMRFYRPSPRKESPTEYYPAPTLDEEDSAPDDPPEPKPEPPPEPPTELPSRTVPEILKEFTTRGCRVEVRPLGPASSSGGVILIAAPTMLTNTGLRVIDWKAPVKFIPAEFTGNERSPGKRGNRIRYYKVWLLVPGNLIPCTQAEFNNSSPEEHFHLPLEHRSPDYTGYWITPEALAATRLLDLDSAFDVLGVSPPKSTPPEFTTALDTLLPQSPPPP